LEGRCPAQLCVLGERFRLANTVPPTLARDGRAPVAAGNVVPRSLRAARTAVKGSVTAVTAVTTSPQGGLAGGQNQQALDEELSPQKEVRFDLRRKTKCLAGKEKKNFEESCSGYSRP
jgi:hypothetical protein